MAEYLVTRVVYQSTLLEAESANQAIDLADELPDEAWDTTNEGPYEADLNDE